jgi:hypothetical protein
MAWCLVKHKDNFTFHLKGKNHVEDLGINGRIILELIVRKWGGGGVDCIHLAQGRDHWQALVNTAMNFSVPYKAGDFFIN